MWKVYASIRPVMRKLAQIPWRRFSLFILHPARQNYGEGLVWQVVSTRSV